MVSSLEKCKGWEISGWCLDFICNLERIWRCAILLTITIIRGETLVVSPCETRHYGWTTRKMVFLFACLLHSNQSSRTLSKTLAEYKMDVEQTRSWFMFIKAISLRLDDHRHWWIAQNRDNHWDGGSHISKINNRMLDLTNTEG